MPRALPLALLPLLAAGCFTETRLIPTVQASDTPAVVLESTYGAIGYDATDGTCFQVPAAGLGTGYASRPDLALGTIWLRDLECPGGDCSWSPTLEIYTGPSRIEDEEFVAAFDGFTFFGSSAASDVLAEVFGAQLSPGDLARVTSGRAYEGLVDYSQLDAQQWLEEWQATHELEVYEDAGFAWNVHLYQWEAVFYEGTFDRPDADDDEAVVIDDVVYRPSGRTLTGYEVFVCVVDFL